MSQGDSRDLTPECQHARGAPRSVHELERRDDDHRAGRRQLREVRQLREAVLPGAEQVVVHRERWVEGAG